jgi:hypothetical protein
MVLINCQNFVSVSSRLSSPCHPDPAGSGKGSDDVNIVLKVLRTHYALNVFIRSFDCAQEDKGAYCHPDFRLRVIPIPLEAGRDLKTKTSYSRSLEHTTH